MRSSTTSLAATSHGASFGAIATSATTMFSSPSRANNAVCAPAAELGGCAAKPAVVTDRLLPNVPIRQYVLSLPHELRGLAATKPHVLTALGRIFAEEIARRTKRLTGVAGTETGSRFVP